MIVAASRNGWIDHDRAMIETLTSITRAGAGIVMTYFAKPAARLPRLNQIFGRIEDWTMTKTKFEAMNILNEFDIPCGPILSMKEIAEDESLRATGTIVEVDHPTRGKYISVGNPIKLSDSPTDVTRSPLLGEHTEEILRKVLGYNDNEVADIRHAGALDPAPKRAAP